MRIFDDVVYYTDMPNNVGGSLGVGSLKLQNVQGVFDVKKESDIIGLLKLVHQNPIDPKIKNHLRDLIFTYRQDNLDANIGPIKQAFAELGVNVISPASLTTHTTHATALHPLGSVRPAPSFSSRQTENNLDTSQTKKNVVTSSVSEAVSAEVTQKTVSQAQFVPVTSAEATHVPVPEYSHEVTVLNTVAIQARIADIKRQVNEKVGNPVNLIDAHNEVGREYMNALLDAMKKANGGKQNEAEEAMQRLEASFEKVQNTLKVGDASPMEKEIPVHMSPEPVAAPQTEQKPEVIVVTPVEKVPVEAMPQENAPRAQARALKLQEKLDNLTLAAKLRTAQTRVPVQEQTEAVRPVSIPQPQTTTVQQSEHLRSVAEDKQLQDLLRSNREKEIISNEAQEKSAIAAMDPLFTPDVNSGLSQLLSEWSLFKSSGFFGTGPSGKDHSLYLKLAPLTMATVIAGRFEGATPLIKQSITDYMNGWRYEDGVIHEHGETFEHYLRKVVHYIISKKKQPAYKK